MVRLLHLADLHLDSPFRGLRRTRPQLAEALRDASLRALDLAIQAAVALHSQVGLDAVTFAGDLFDAGSPSLRARARLTAGLRQLDAAGIPCFLVAGNHDPANASDLWHQLALPPSARLFGPGWHCAELRQDGRHVATLVGRSYVADDADREALDGLPGPEAPLRIGLLHADVDGPSGERSYSPVRLQTLRDSGYDAWLLGHVHGRRELCAAPLVAYPGTPQGRDAGVGEIGRKGALLVELEPGRPARSTFVPLGPIQWSVVEADITGLTTEQEVVDRVQESLDAELSGSPVGSATGVAPADGLIAQVRLVGTAGSAELWQRLALADTMAQLAETLTAGERQPFVIVEDVRSEASGPLPARSELGLRSDLLGDFLRALDEAGAPQSEPADLPVQVWSSLAQKGAAREFVRATGWAPDRTRVLAGAERLVLSSMLSFLEGADDDA